MSDAGIQFRNAAFGGFNRQDVLEYIEQSARLNNEKLAELEEENRRLQEAKDALEAENGTLRAQCEGMTETSAELEQLRAEVEALRKLQPEVDAFRELKAKLADIEVEARLRGENILQKANEDAEDVTNKALADADNVTAQAKAEAENLILQAKNEAAAIRTNAELILSQSRRTFDTTRTDLAATSAHLAGELERIRGTILRLSTALDEQGAALSSLSLPEEG